MSATSLPETTAETGVIGSRPPYGLAGFGEEGCQERERERFLARRGGSLGPENTRRALWRGLGSVGRVLCLVLMEEELEREETGVVVRWR